MKPYQNTRGPLLNNLGKILCALMGIVCLHRVRCQYQLTYLSMSHAAKFEATWKFLELAFALGEDSGEGDFFDEFNPLHGIRSDYDPILEVFARTFDMSIQTCIKP